MYQHLIGGCKDDGARLFSVVPSDRTKDNGHKLKHWGWGEAFHHLKIRKHFFTVKVTALAQVAQRGCVVSLFGHTYV